MATSLSITGPLPTTTTASGGSAPKTAASGFGMLLDALAGLLGKASAGGAESHISGPIGIDAVLDRAHDASASIRLGGMDVGAALSSALLPGGPAPPADAAAPPNPLATLIDALMAIDAGSSSGNDQPLLDRIEGAVDALLAALTPVAAAPGPAPAAAPDGGSSAAPVTLAAQIVADSRAAASADASAGRAAPVATAPAPEGKPQSEAPRQLAEIIANAADRIDPQSPLADKLRALAEGLKAGGVDQAALARLGLTDPTAPDLDRLDKAVAALLTSAPVTTPALATPARSDFAKVHLDLPTPATPRVKGSDAQSPADDAPTELDSVPDRPAFATPRPHTGEAKNEGPSATAPQAAASPADKAAQPADASADPPIGSNPQRTDAPILPGAHRTALPQPYAAPAALVVPQVAVEIARQSVKGASRFQIRLDPAELGRIDVDLDLDASGTTTARLTVDRVETLDLLKRDQPALEKALAQAGLDQSRTTLEFSLRQDTGSNPSQRQPLLPAYPGASDAADPPPDATAVTQLYRATARPGGLDLIA